MARISRAIVAVGSLLVLAFLATDAVLVYASLETIADSNARADDSRRVIHAVERVMSTLTDAETGQRGYLLTGRDAYLEPFRSADAGLGPVLSRLRAVAHDGGGRRGRTDELTRLAAEKMAELRESVSIRTDRGQAAALEVVSTDRGIDLMREVRRVAAGFLAEEDRALRAHAGASRAAVRRAVWTFTATTATALLLLAGVAYLQGRDARDRARAAEAIRRSEAWLSTTLTSIGDGLIATDARGRLRFINPVAQALTGWTQAEAEGRTMAEVFPIVNEATREPADDPVARVIREGAVLGLANHTLLIARDGTETPIDDSAAPIKGDDGAVNGVVLVFRDVTDRRRQEAVIAEQVKLAEFVRDVSFALTEGATSREMLQRCAEASVRHLDAAFARVWTVNEAGDVLELRASAGLYTHTDGDHARVPVGRFKIGRIAEERRPHLTNAVLGDPLVPAQDWARREGLVAFAGYPLVVEDRLLGVWAMFARHPLSETTLRAMESVANGISLGVERRRAAEALAESEARKGAILKTALDAIITINGDGRVVEFNPAAEQIFGHRRDEAVGRPLHELIIPEALRDAHRRGLSRYLAGGASTVLGRRIEINAVRAGGEEFPVELAVTRISSEGPPLFTAHLRDISERKRGERRLEFLAEAGVSLSSSLEYKDTLENIARLAVKGFADFCVFDLAADDGGRIERLASAHSDPSRQAEADRARRFVPTPESLNHPVPRTIATGETQFVPAVDDDWLRRAATSDAHYEFLRGLDLASFLTVPVPIRGRTLGALTFCLCRPARGYDASDVKLAEDLGRRAGVSLSNALLYQEAREANRAKDQFLAVLSHELRTPLNPILLAVTALLERPARAEEIRPDLEMIKQNISLEARLIDDLLDVMRIVRGKMPLHWEVVDAHALIRQAVQICRSEVFGKVLRLEVGLDAAHHHINADPARLQQVFWNLIKNAVKFTPEGGSVAIRTANEHDPEGHAERLLIEISDTGIGIEPDIIGRIFDPFQQGETSITRRFGGLGLGLAISKGIVDGHGGTLTVKSGGKDQGTAFTVELRALPEPKSDAHDRPGPASAGDDEPDAIKPRNILLVEDEQATIRLMARLLRGLGHRVTTASTIASAVDSERRGDFDLIVSDIGLPDGSGLELMRQVVSRRGPVPAIALTGYGMEEDIQRSRAAGFTAHMTKPIDFTKLEAMIRQITSRPGTAPPAEDSQA